MEVAARHGTCAGAQAEARRPTRPRRAPHAAADRRRSGKGGPGRRAPPTPPPTSHLPVRRMKPPTLSGSGRRLRYAGSWTLTMRAKLSSTMAAAVREGNAPRPPPTAGRALPPATLTAHARWGGAAPGAGPGARVRALRGPALFPSARVAPSRRGAAAATARRREGGAGRYSQEGAAAAAAEPGGQRGAGRGEGAAAVGSPQRGASSVSCSPEARRGGAGGSGRPAGLW